MVLLAAACGGGEEVTPAPPRLLPAGIAREGTLLRLPSEGGGARLYTPDSLAPLDWQIARGVPAIRRALGTDLDDRMVYALTDEGAVIGLDLISRQQRPYLARAAMVTGSPDGTVLGVDSAGRPQRFVSRNLTTYRGTVETGPGTRLVRARGNLLVAYTPGRGEMQMFEEDGEIRQVRVPNGHLASSWFGDLLMVVSAEGLTLVNPTRDDPPEEIHLGGMPLTGEFSPSAHRIYVSRARGDILMLDRFNSHDKVGEVSVPGPATALRPDRSGRWLLARPEEADSIWLIDLVREELVATIASPWADDLPLVTGGRTLLIREGNDVVAWDLGRASPAEFTRIAGGAGDIYLAIPWTPAARASPPPAFASGADSPRPPPAADPAPAAPPTRAVETAPDSVENPDRILDVYIQVSSSQNAPYARALADQLRQIGFRARVLDPGEPGAGYKVVVGPYASRDEAEADGKRLGRPYFVTTRGGPDT
jgi:hypothetical protein